MDDNKTIHKVEQIEKYNNPVGQAELTYATLEITS